MIGSLSIDAFNHHLGACDKSVLSIRVIRTEKGAEMVEGRISPLAVL